MDKMMNKMETWENKSFTLCFSSIIRDLDIPHEQIEQETEAARRSKCNDNVK